MPLRLTIVTAERQVLQRDDVTRLVVPTTEGQITILPSHAALMTSLDIGEMLAYTPGGVEPLAVHGGFLQVVNDEISVLADAAETAELIDEERAEAARRRAEERLSGRIVPDQGSLDILRARAALQRSLLRLNVRRRRAGTGVPSARP